MRRPFIAILILAILPFTAAATWDDFSLSVVTLASDVPVTLFCSPDGDGRRLDGAALIGLPGAAVDATIHLELIDWNGQPVAGFPAEDIWLAPGDAGLALCGGHVNADGPTDAAGCTTFSGALPAGGHRAPDDPAQITVYAAGYPLPADLSGLALNSSDLNGDLVVDLTDVIRFAEIWSTHTDDYAADFHCDGVVNLSDLVVFAAHLSTVCP